MILLIFLCLICLIQNLTASWEKGLDMVAKKEIEPSGEFTTET